MRMYFKGNHSYYLAYCFKTKTGSSGFADMILTNKSKLQIASSEDIEVVKSYIIDKAKSMQNIDITEIVLMDWRELKNE